MKILRITSLGYVGGGVENGIMLVNKELRRLGHEVRVVSSNHRPDVPHWSDYEFPALAYRSFVLKPFYRAWYPDAYATVRAALRDFRPDVVQVHSTFETSPSVFDAAREYPTVLTVHGAEDYTRQLLLWAFPLRFFKNTDSLTVDNLNMLGKLHFLYHKLVSLPMYRRSFRSVDTFVAFSTYMRTMLAEEGIESVLVPNATQLYEPAPPQVGRPSLLYVGRLERIKGVHRALEALALVRETRPDAELVVAGTGEYEGTLKQLAHDAGLGGAVHFLGHRTRDELYRAYKEAMIVLVPSIWPEPFGKVGIEAMSVGRPVIASDVGGIAEWLTDGETGFLVPPDDARTLAERIQTLINDPDRCVAMSRNALQRVTDFSIERHTERMLDVYANAIKQHGATRG